MTKPKKPWVPKMGDKYYYIDHDGVVYTYRWSNDIYDKKISSFLGFFPTKKAAQARVKEIRELLKDK